MGINRRGFLASGIGAAILLPEIANVAIAQQDKPMIGIQLYCVRGEFEKDVVGTIKKIAELGYQGVEFWGYDGTDNVFKDWSAERLRKLLDENKLRCCGMHLTVKALTEKLDTTIKNNKILGNHYLNIAAADNLMQSPETIKKFAGILNDAAKKAKEHQMKVGYHCHSFDFKKMGDSTGWDILFSQTSPDVVMQLDTGNCVEGGGKPIEILKKFPGKAATVHIKEYKDAPLEQKGPDWVEIIKICKTLQHTKWYIIEQGEAENAGFEIAKKSIKDLKELLG